MSVALVWGWGSAVHYALLLARSSPSSALDQRPSEVPVQCPRPYTILSGGADETLSWGYTLHRLVSTTPVSLKLIISETGLKLLLAEIPGKRRA